MYLYLGKDIILKFILGTIYTEILYVGGILSGFWYFCHGIY